MSFPVCSLEMSLTMCIDQSMDTPCLYQCPLQWISRLVEVYISVTTCRYQVFSPNPSSPVACPEGLARPASHRQSQNALKSMLHGLSIGTESELKCLTSIRFSSKIIAPIHEYSYAAASCTDVNAPCGRCTGIRLCTLMCCIICWYFV